MAGEQSGSISTVSGNAEVASGDVIIGSGSSASVDAVSLFGGGAIGGDIDISAADGFDNSGSVSISGGALLSSHIDKRSGNLYMTSKAATGNSGVILLQTGTSEKGRSGSMTLSTADGYLSAGDMMLKYIFSYRCC